MNKYWIKKSLKQTHVVKYVPQDQKSDHQVELEKQSGISFWVITHISFHRKEKTHRTWDKQTKQGQKNEGNLEPFL